MKYYISVIREGAGARLVSGPYKTHDAALAVVATVRAWAAKQDPWLDFDAWGTCRSDSGPERCAYERVSLVQIRGELCDDFDAGG